MKNRTQPFWSFWENSPNQVLWESRYIGSISTRLLAIGCVHLESTLSSSSSSWIVQTKSKPNIVAEILLTKSQNPLKAAQQNPITRCFWFQPFAQPNLRVPSPSAHLPQEQPLTWHPELLVAPQFGCACVADDCHKSNSKRVLSIEERKKLLGKRSQSTHVIKQTSGNQGRIPIGALQGPVASLLSKWWNPLCVWSQKKSIRNISQLTWSFKKQKNWKNTSDLSTTTKKDRKQTSHTKPPPTNEKYPSSNCCANI